MFLKMLRLPMSRLDWSGAWHGDSCGGAAGRFPALQPQTSLPGRSLMGPSLTGRSLMGRSLRGRSSLRALCIGTGLLLIFAGVSLSAWAQSSAPSGAMLSETATPSLESVAPALAPDRLAPGRLSRLPGSGPVSLSRLLEATVSAHPTVRAKQGELQAAGYDLDGARWGWFPTLSSELQADDGSTRQAVLQLQQPLWTGGRVEGQIDLATANREAASAAVIEAEQQVLLQAGSGFFEYTRQEARIEIARANEAEHRRLLEMIRRRVVAEVSPLADETLAAARYQQALAERLQFERALEAARVSLEQLAGISLSSGLRAQDGLPALPGTELESLDMAMQYSAERRRLQALVVAARAQIDVTRSNTRPTVFAAVRQQVGPLQFGQERTRALVGLEFKPGPGLSSLTAVQAATSRVDAAEESVITHERQLAQAVRSAWVDLQAQRLQLEPSRAIAQSTDDVVASYLRQYQVGRKTWLDVLNAQRETTQARYSVADLEAGIRSAQLRLLTLAGRIDARSLSLLGP